MVSPRRSVWAGRHQPSLSVGSHWPVMQTAGGPLRVPTRVQEPSQCKRPILAADPAARMMNHGPRPPDFVPSATHPERKAVEPDEQLRHARENCPPAADSHSMVTTRRLPRKPPKARFGQLVTSP